MKKKIRVCSICLRTDYEVPWSNLDYHCFDCSKDYKANWQDSRHHESRKSRIEICKHYGSRHQDGDQCARDYIKALELRQAKTDDKYYRNHEMFLLEKLRDV